MGSKDSSEGCCGQRGSGLPAVKGTRTELPNQTRRSVLSWLLGGGVTASLVSFFYPVIRFMNPPKYVEAVCEDFYADEVGRPGLAPGIYFRLLTVGYFEGIDSQRGIAWRASDSLSIRSFVRSSLSRPKLLFDSFGYHADQNGFAAHRRISIVVITGLCVTCIRSRMYLKVDAGFWHSTPSAVSAIWMPILQRVQSIFHNSGSWPRWKSADSLQNGHCSGFTPVRALVADLLTVGFFSF